MSKPTYHSQAPVGFARGMKPSSFTDSRFPQPGNMDRTGPKSAKEFAGDVFTEGLMPKRSDFTVPPTMDPMNMAPSLPAPMFQVGQNPAEPDIILPIRARLFAIGDEPSFLLMNNVFINEAKADHTFGDGALLMSLQHVNEMVASGHVSELESLKGRLTNSRMRPGAVMHRTAAPEEGMLPMWKRAPNTGVRYIAMMPEQFWEKFAPYGRLAGQSPAIDEPQYAGATARQLAIHHFGREDFVPQWFSPCISVGDSVGYVLVRFGTHPYRPVDCSAAIAIPPLQLMPYCSQFRHLLNPTEPREVPILNNALKNTAASENREGRQYMKVPVDYATNPVFRRTAGYIASVSREDDKSIVAPFRLAYDDQGYSLGGQVYIDQVVIEQSERADLTTFRGPMEPFSNKYFKSVVAELDSKSVLKYRAWASRQMKEGFVTQAYMRGSRPTVDTIFHSVTDLKYAKSMRVYVNLDRV